MLVDVGQHHELVCTRSVDERKKLLAHAGYPPNEHVGAAPRAQRLLMRVVPVCERLLYAGQRPIANPLEEPHHGELARRRKSLGLPVVFRADHADGEDRPRLAPVRGWNEASPVKTKRAHGVVRVDVVRKCEAEALLCRHEGPSRFARAEQPSLRGGDVDWDRANRAAESGARGPLQSEVLHQLGETLWEVVDDDRVAGTTQSGRSARIGSGRAAKPEVDPPGEECVEDAERLGDFQGGMVRKHDATGANTHRLRDRRNLPDEDFRCGASETARVVVLGKPVAAKAERLGVTSEVECVSQRVGRSQPGWDRREVEHGEGQGHCARSLEH